MDREGPTAKTDGGEKIMCQIAINIPNEVLFDTKMNQEEANRFARCAVALGYYTQRRVSIGYCAQIAGMTKEEISSEPLLIAFLCLPYPMLCLHFFIKRDSFLLAPLFQHSLHRLISLLSSCFLTYSQRISASPSGSTIFNTVYSNILQSR